MAKKKKNDGQQGQSTPPMDQLKERLKTINKGGLLGMLGEVQKTTPEQWKDPEAVKNMAKKFAEQLNIPVDENRLNEFMKAYKDATKGGKPNADVEDLVKKYGNGKIDDATVKEMKKFLKPKD